MNRLALVISILALGISTARAQEFATLNPDAATAGTADVSTAVSSTSFSVYGNAAAALFDYDRFAAGFSYSPWKSGGATGSFYSVGGYYSVNEKNTLEAGARICKMPGTGGYRPMESSVDVAYARLVHNCAGVAVTAHYIHGSYGNSVDYNALSFDLSAYAQIPASHDLSVAVGARIADIGFALGDSRSLLPSRASVGASICAPAPSITGSVEVDYRFAPNGYGSFGASLGVEYTLMQLLSFRAGYHVADKHGMNYGTAGAGIKFMMLRFDFAYRFAEKSSPFRNMYTITAGITF